MLITLLFRITYLVCRLQLRFLTTIMSVMFLKKSIATVNIEIHYYNRILYGSLLVYKLCLNSKHRVVL